MSSPFELKVRPTDDGRYILELYKNTEKGSTQVTRFRTWHLELSYPYICRILRENGHKPASLKRTRRLPFPIDETSGAKLLLLGKGIGALSKRSRIEDIIAGISTMTREEALYWNAQIRHTKNGKQNGLVAFRILLSGKS